MSEVKKKTSGFHRAVTAVMLSVLALVFVALALELWFSKSTNQYKETQNNGRAIQKAQNKELERGEIESDAKRFGIDCLWLNNDDCRRFIQRVSRNPDLLSAFKEAKNGDVIIFPCDRFHIGNSWVYIDIRKSDEEILKFL